MGFSIRFCACKCRSGRRVGAIWKFPYLVGSNGGSAFLFPFIVLTFTIGLVLLIAELTVGRAGAGCIVTAFRKLGGKNWGRAGYLGVITGFLILSFYSAIGGWTIAYFVNACLGAGLVADQAQLGAHFASISGDPELAIGYQALFLIITAWVVAYGVSSGIERLSKVLMPLLFILMLIIIVRSLFYRVHSKASSIFSVGILKPSLSMPCSRPWALLSSLCVWAAAACSLTAVIWTVKST